MTEHIGAAPSEFDATTDTTPPGGDHVRLTAAQVRLLRRHRPTAGVVGVLVATDRGGPKRFAKRWYAWYVRAYDVMMCPASTPGMKRRASFWRSANDLATGCKGGVVRRDPAGT